MDGQATSGDVQLDAHNEQAGIDLEIADRSGTDLISKGFGRCWGRNRIASGGLVPPWLLRLLSSSETIF